MKDYMKDVLMICKGHFNEIKYETTYDALKAYQAQWTGSQVKDIGDNDMLIFLKPIISEYFTYQSYEVFLYERLIKGIIFFRINNGKDLEIDLKYIINLIIQQICALPVRNPKNGAWIIDLSDYELPNVEII